MEFAVGEGIAEDRVLLDPGIGFGKTVAHNLELLRRLDEIAAVGRPLLVGTSRKSFLGIVAGGRGESVRRPWPSAAGHDRHERAGLERGASVFRVHDVAPVRTRSRWRLLR